MSVSISANQCSVIGVGVDLKNSLCLLQEGQAQAWPVSGDINDPEIYLQVASELARLKDVDALACDLHPDLQSTRLAEQLAERLKAPLMRVQHHHAHIAAVMAEHAIQKPVIGLAMDGYGYGSDGSAWGGECFFVDGGESVRVGCIKPVAMPGGDAASRQPWRMAVSWLAGDASLSSLFDDMPAEAVEKLCRSELTPVTSSAGRLFDAASAIVLGRREVTFEGEAAIALERAASEAKAFKQLSYTLNQVDGCYQLDCREALAQLAEGVETGESKAGLAAGFHQMLAEGMVEMAIRLASEKEVKTIILAGGCFLNALLKEGVRSRLQSAGLKVFISEKMPQGDGAIALGQVWVAAQKMKRGQI